MAEPRDCRSNSFRVTNIVLDLESIPAKTKDSEWFAVAVCQTTTGSRSDYAILANLSRSVPQVQVDIEFSVEDNPKFFMKSASAVAYVNGYEINGK